MAILETWAMRQINGLKISDERKGQYEQVLSTFGKQGHSGSSANYCLSFVNRYLDCGYDTVKEILDKMLEESKKEDDGYGIQTSITKNILEIMDMMREFEFGKDEIHNLIRLMDWKPIVSLTGIDEEWDEADKYFEDANKTQQNLVCSSVFRDHFDNSTAHMVAGKIYSENGGHTWFSASRGTLKSSIPVEFPFWVPDDPEFIYLNGYESEEIITDEARIKELYDEWDRKVQEDEKEYAKRKGIQECVSDWNEHLPSLEILLEMQNKGLV
jgi:hypothetical protein